MLYDQMRDAILHAQKHHPTFKRWCSRNKVKALQTKFFQIIPKLILKRENVNSRNPIRFANLCKRTLRDHVGHGSRHFGPRTIGPRTVGPRTAGPRTVGPQGPTVRGPTVRPQKMDSWAPGPNCPGPECPLWKSGQLGPGAQLSGAQLSGARNA